MGVLGLKGNQEQGAGPTPPSNPGFAPDRPCLVGVSLRHMLRPFRFTPLLILALTLQSNALAQHGAWVDIVPLTRNLFGADDAQDLSFAVGWSSSMTDNGWRSLVGFDLGQESQDSFGTTITTTNRRMDLRAGRRWRVGEPDENRPCWIHLGVDLLIESDHVGTESFNLDFNSTNTTTTVESGFSGVLGIQCRITDGFHLVTEARMDGVYVSEMTRVSDSFGGNFEEFDSGWNARLTPPLQLLLVLDL